MGCFRVLKVPKDRQETEERLGSEETLWVLCPIGQCLQSCQLLLIIFINCQTSFDRVTKLDLFLMGCSCSALELGPQQWAELSLVPNSPLKPIVPPGSMLSRVWSWFLGCLIVSKTEKSKVNLSNRAQVEETTTGPGLKETQAMPGHR